VSLYTPYDGEVLPDRELPGLLPDVLSFDGKNLYMRAVPLDRDLVIQDKHYVSHLFSSMGFLEDTWWERSYWIYGVHFYSGARGHGYAKTLFPAGRILTFDDDSVYGYQDLALDPKTPGIFCVPKTPEFIDLAAKLAAAGGARSRPKRAKKAKAGMDAQAESIRTTYVWKDGVPQKPKEMSLTGGRRGVGDAIRKLTKYEYTWHNEASLYPQAMLLTERAFFVAGPPRFNELRTTEFLNTSRTDRFELAPILQDALDMFEGKKGGILCAVDKTNGQKMAELRLASPPVFDGMIAADGKLFLSLKDGSVLCMGSR